MRYPRRSFAPVAAFGASSASTYPLDGVSNVTGAWCVSRPLVSSYGGSLYTDAGGGALSTIFQQIGADSDQNLTDGGTSTRRPTLGNFGPNNRPMADFDGSSDFLATIDAISNFITASEGVVIWAGIIDAFTLNNPTVYDNDIIFGDNTQYMGLFAKNTAGGTILTYNYDGNTDVDSIGSISTATAIVLSWRHKTGQLYLGVNGTEGSGVASGNTQVISGVLNLGGFASGQKSDMKTNALISLSADPGGATLTAIIDDLMDYIGA